jgi:sarcosine oxidase subunit beta
VDKADCVVIGAGIIGAAIAFRLSESGLDVVALETQASPAMGSTGRSAAGVRVQFSEATNIMLSWESIREYRSFPELYGVDAGYRSQGYLFLVPGSRWKTHREALALQRRLGVPVRELTVDEAQEIVPFDPGGIAGVTFGPADGVVDPHAITLAYLRLARERGARLLLDTPVLSAASKAEVWRIETPNDTIEAPIVINAAGAWAGSVARSAGLELPVKPLRRMVFATSPLGEYRSIPLTVDVESAFYLRSEGARILFGRSNPNQVPGLSEGIDWSWLEPTLEAGLARFPWLSRAALDRRSSWWGYYEDTPDHNPVLGRMPGAVGWLNAAGFSGHGVQQAAMVGRLIAEEVVHGRAVSLDIDALRYERFQTGSVRREENIV